MSTFKHQVCVLITGLCLFSTSQVLANKTNICDEALKTSVAKKKLEQGFFQLSSGWPLFYKNFQVANSKGQIVISNGLVYDLNNYANFIKALNKMGYSVLVYAHRSQPENLEKAKELGLEAQDYSYHDLSSDLGELLDGLKIKKKIHLLGLSFGSSVAAHYAYENPERVASLTFMAPLISISQTYLSMIKARREMCRWNPMACIFVEGDEISDRMMLSVEDFNLRNYEFQVPVSLYMAELEDRLLKNQQQEYVDKYLLPQGGKYFLIKESYHAIPGSAPDRSAQLLVKQLSEL